ncbi:class I SAM-dependent methyltransferase [Actinomadura sp. HBU206391]|uniref:class I SAM-dependent methyltransferase n=1 Tax=Actinomadura sp. HBU206391 TaxID=2731692 RepID=UPI00164FCEB7|nr:SAM-dependent methyltransferase [Actinomadura sp. HBU206391]MBC6461835.1 class I SAM-dependent methyltransferase [Actinomadura sp. HBU206391]
MRDDSLPSQTALTAAAARAAHLIVDDDPLIFSDSLAWTFLGDRAEELLGFHRIHGTHLVLVGARTAVVTRGRYTEDRLAEAIRRGVGQYVILGAGLDSFAYRSELAGRVRVFEVDHPATQRYKREVLADSGVVIPDSVAFVAADFETRSLAGHLVREGFDPTSPAFVCWLGVTMYLTREAIDETLKSIGAFAPGTELVVDYMVPADLRDADGETYVTSVMPVAAENGEPWLTFLSPREMSALLEEAGLAVTEHVRQRDAVDAALWDRRDALRPFDLSMLARARVRSGE